MRDQGKKVRRTRSGESCNAPAPASHGCQDLPVDFQNFKCYNGITRQATCDCVMRKGAGKCDVDERTNTNEAYREAIIDLICKIDNEDYLLRIYNLTQYLYTKS